MENNYATMSLAELKEIAKQKGIKNISILRKKELIDILTDVDKSKQTKEEKLVKEDNIVKEIKEVNEYKEVKVVKDTRDSRDFSNMDSQGTKRPSATNNNEIEQLDSGETKEGILEVLPDGYGFIRCDNFLPGEH